MHKVDVHGIENHKVQGVPIGTVAGLVETHRCKVILIMHQYAIYGKGRTIHSSGQLEHFGNKVDDRSRVVGGKQRITTLEGYVIPLQIREGLAHFHMTPPTDDDLDIYPHVILTSDNDWDPTLLDNEIDIENITRELDDLPPENVYGDIRFDPRGNYRGVYASSRRDLPPEHCSQLEPLSLKTNDFEDFLEEKVFDFY